MKTYKAVAEREDGWWIITVPELDTVTQARRIDQIEHMARDLIAVWLEVDYDDISVDVDVRVPDAWRSEARSVWAHQEVAEAAAAEAAQAARRAAQRLHAQGITVRDIGQVLGVSPQRVSQLLNAKPVRSEGQVVDLLEALTSKVEKAQTQRKTRVRQSARRRQASNL